jgi:hypothetical protein
LEHIGRRYQQVRDGHSSVTHPLAMTTRVLVSAPQARAAIVLTFLQASGRNFFKQVVVIVTCVEPLPSLKEQRFRGFA